MKKILEFKSDKHFEVVMCKKVSDRYTKFIIFTTSKKMKLNDQKTFESRDYDKASVEFFETCEYLRKNHKI